METDSWLQGQEMISSKSTEKRDGASVHFPLVLSSLFSLSFIDYPQPQTDCFEGFTADTTEAPTFIYYASGSQYPVPGPGA